MTKEEIEFAIDSYKMEMIESLKDFVSINSIYDEKSVDANNPFGKGVSGALNYITNLAKKDGFEVTNYDNYCVEIAYGKGEYLDILAHCDVVEVSNNWKIPPFSRYSDETFVYGRGTQDDKGPLIAAYYALKVIKENNIPCNKRIRFVVGGNEESGSRCLKHYYGTLKKEYPSLGFTPDADFPLINGEKGITRLKLTLKGINNDITSIAGGRALNIVMDEVTFTIKGNEKKYYGKSSHGSRPEGGVNAFTEACIDLKATYPEFEKLYTDLNDYYGSGLGIDAYDDKLKKLTMNIGKVELVNHDIDIYLDIRYPLSINAKAMKESIEKRGYKCEILTDEEPLYIDENSSLVKTLLSSYNYFTGDDSKAFTIGGGTYAKYSKNVVAFGMMFSDDIDYMHQDNEKIRIDHYILGSKIYLKAILELIK